MLTARGAEDLDRAEQEMRAAGADVFGMVADMSEPEVPERLVTATVERFGRIDIVVANAGGPPAGRALEVDDDAIRAAVEANLLSAVRLVRAAVPHHADRGVGPDLLHLLVLGGPAPARPGPVQHGPGRAYGPGSRRRPPIWPPRVAGSP